MHDNTKKTHKGERSVACEKHIPYIESFLCVRMMCMYHHHFYLAICFLACVPSRNPFLNRRVMVFMYRIRPVPFVRRPFALIAQLNERILGFG